MSDQPNAFTHQQEHARSISGEHLEVFGKKAAADWANGKYASLTEAVIGTVKEAMFSPEQVKRVVEFTNTAAFLSEFKKEGSAHRVIEFEGGPADASEILKDLNSGGGGSVFDRGTLDYSSPPSHGGHTKTASADEDDALLREAFGVKEAEAEEPFANPYGPIIDLRDKLAGAADHLLTEISGLEVAYAECGDRVYHHVKQAALSNVSLGQIMQAWESTAPSEEYVKVAFELFTPRLLREGVFHGGEEMLSSLDKVASQGSLVNPEHELVVDFADFCGILNKLAEAREVRKDVVANHAGLTGILKQADSTAGKIIKGITGAAADAGGAVDKAVSKHIHPLAGTAAGLATRFAPHMAAGIAANEAYTHYQNSPSLPARAARATVRTVAQQVPGTQAQQEHEWRIQNGQ
jgi:hypothetical protein